MVELKLAVTMREKISGKALVHARKEGRIPAVMYGHGDKPKMLWVNALAFTKTFAKAGGSSIISLDVAEGKGANVIIQETDLDPMTNRVSHVDFFQVSMDEALETHVPLEFVGESVAVRELGGILIKTLEEVSISCLPKDLPHSIEVHVNLLTALGANLQIKDLKIPAGVKVLTDELTTVALIETPRTEAQMAALNEKVDVDVTKVEGVIKEEAAASTDGKSSEKKEEKK